FDGKITAIVTTTGFPDVTDYDFKWTAPSPSVFDASGVFTGKAPATAPLVFASSATQKLGEGQYKVEVTNTVNLCKSDAFVSLETKAVPPELVIVSSADQLTCTPDGSVTVERIDFQNLTNADHNGFDFQFFKGNASGTPVAQTAADPLFTNPRVMTPFSNLGEGIYFVKVTRGTGILPGSGCTSAPYRADITDRSANPEVTLVSQANTACDPLNADGKITVTATTRLYNQVTKAYAPYPASTEYDFEWLQKPASTTFDLPIPAAASPAVFASSASQKLSDGNYELKLTNRDNKCFSVASVVLEKNPLTPFIAGLTAIDRIKCAPDGSITVGDIGFQGNPNSPHANFDFNWFFESEATPLTLTVPVTGADKLDPVSLPAITPGKYLLRIVPVAGTGVGCSSVLYDATISDKTVRPVVSFTTLPNTACDGQYDGAITVNASTTGFAPATTKYRYEWTVPAPPSGLPASTFDPAIVESIAPQTFSSAGTQRLGDGDYTVKVTNLDNLCDVTGTVNVKKSTVPMLITGIDKVDQLDCNNNASAFVTAITIDSSEDKVLDPADYSFTWSTDGNVVVNNVAGAKLLDKTLFPTINQGNYVVKAVRTSGKAPASGCDSAPVSIQIIDKSTNPLADLSFTPNSACNVNLPNGQMVATAKEQSGATSGPYTFAWTVNPNDALAPAFIQADVGNVSTLNQATDGKYQVIVTNSTTGCKFTGTREVTVDKSLSQPTILDFTKFNPTSCDG
ncbi:MAG: hypothetical protein ACKO3B_10780, partial [Bacteroidota bacterium]